MARESRDPSLHFFLSLGLLMSLGAYSIPTMAEEPEALAEFTADASPIEPATPRDVAELLSDADAIAEDTAEDAGQESEGDTSGETSETTRDADGTEVINERFANRMVKIERHVAQDSEGNYFNQGRWTQWDEKGNLIAQGDYQDGKRHGKWFRWYSSKQAELFSEPAYKEFTLPLGSEADFVAGELHGDWTVFDAKKRLVCVWRFENGTRQGRSVWYAPSGHVRQEVNFQNGQMHGELRQTGADGRLAVRERYVDGHRLANEVSYHAPGKKKSAGEMLFALTYSEIKYDWWTGNGEVIPAPKGQDDQRHGRWTWWYPNGQKQLEGAYQYDQPIGNFTWWFSNGQRQLAGEYVGGQQHGKFIWWYETGQKQREGNYATGVPVGNWAQWTTAGRIVQTEDYQGKTDDRLAMPEELSPAAPARLQQPPVRIGARKRVQR